MAIKKKKIAARKKSKKKVSKKPTRKTTKVAKKKKVTKKATKKKAKKAKKKVAKKKVTRKKRIVRASKKKKQRMVRAAAKPGTVSRAKVRAVVEKVKEDEAKKKAVVKKTRPVRKSKNYINNKDLLFQVSESKKAERMSDTLARMLQMLCKRYASRGQFASYTYNEDMQAYAMMMLVRTWNSFKPEKSSNPFAFYTQCIKNSFIQFLKLEQYQRDVRDKMLVKQGLAPSHGYTEREREAAKEKEKEKKKVDPQEKKNQQLVEC